jgi:hypothetical protein
MSLAVLFVQNHQLVVLIALSLQVKQTIAPLPALFPVQA